MRVFGTLAAAAMVVAGTVGAAQARRPNPEPADAMVNLILGACLSEVARTPLPEGAIRVNPLARRPLTAPADPRLTPRAQPVMVSTGTVYLDHHERGACEVFASGVDREQVMARLLAAASARGLAVQSLPASDGGTWLALGAGPDGQVATLALTQPAADQLSARISLGPPRAGATTLTASAPPAPAAPARPPAVAAAPPPATTAAVAPAAAPPAPTASSGRPAAFTPTPAQNQALMNRLRVYLRETDAGRYPTAYAMLSEPLRQLQSQEAWSARVAEFNAEAGVVRDHRVGAVTWGRDPPGAPLPGIYAVVDMVSHYANIQRHCGFIVLYQPPSGGEFQVMRAENIYIPDARAAGYDAPGSTAGVDAIWAEMTRGCPNYEAGVAAAPLG
jgi:hypothetical protein